jgi:hypothetical protein
MSDRRHPGPHPDADQLSAFMEGALTGPEGEVCLAHLAECAECRNTVFLAQHAVPAPAVEAPVAPPWRRWLPPLSLAAAAAACGLIAVLWMHPRPKSAPASPEVAAVRQATPTLPSISSAAPEAALLRPAQPPRARTELAAKKPAPAVPMLQPPPPAPSGVVSGLITGAATQSGQPVAQQTAPLVASDQAQAAPAARGAVAGPAPTPATGSAAVAQQTPGSIAAMRTFSALKRTAPAPVPPTASSSLAAAPAVNGTLALVTPLHLTIEHNQGPDNGFSAIRGAVTDPSGALISGASVTLRSTAGQIAATTTTGADGRFTLPAVAPGPYEVQISAPGFQSDSERLDLQARDLALLSPTLKTGAATETVEVSAAATPAPTTPVPTDAQLAAIAPVLPAKLPATATVAKNGRMLALDSAGTLYLSRDAGRRWKKIHRVWTGSIVHLTLAEPAGSSSFTKKEIPSVAPPPLFALTTTDGAIWISNDGAHWRLR